MNVLILNNILFTAENGVIPEVQSIKDTMIYGLCLGFKKLGHDVTLAAAEDYRPVASEDYDFEIIFFRSRFAKILKPSVLPYSPELKKWIKANHVRYDLIISSETFSFQSYFASRICPEKTVIWQEMTEHQKKFHRIPSKIWHFLVCPFMRKTKSVVARSNKAKDFIEKFMPRVSDQIIDHGIDIEKFKPSLSKKRRLITSSQLIFRKNVDGIIRKFHKFHSLHGYEDIELIIAGKGEEEASLKKLVSDLKLDQCVKFAGYLQRKDLGVLISESLAFLVNTRKDLNMVSIPEAIVSGTPIVTNLNPASAQYIAENQLGLAKDDWDELDLKYIVDNADEFSQNCISFRENLTNEHSAQLFCSMTE